MKMQNRSWLNPFAACLAVVSLFPAMQARALDVLNPNGTLYTGISDNSHYNDSYTSANLFDYDMTGVALGTFISFDATEYARQGGGTCYVAFELDQIYTNIGSVFYSQRYGTSDFISQISVWTSDSTPFTAADPGGSPAGVVSVVTGNSSGAFWNEFALTNHVSGRYFLLKMEQSSPNGNPGGRELRLGVFVGQPPVVAQQSSDTSIYAGKTVRLSVQATGTAPLSYQWFKGASLLSNGGNVSGANTNGLVISSAAFGDSDAYSCVITNSYGSVTSAVVNLSVIAAPTNAAVQAVLSNSPVGYWQLNEPNGSTIALEQVAGLNGSYGSGSGVGVAGPQPSDFPGFSATNAAVQIYAFQTNSAVALPPLNMTGTNGGQTIIAWINPAGTQSPYTGIVFCRGGNTVAGPICSSDGTKLAYQWGAQGYDFNSGLVLPVNQWSFVAVVREPNKVTLYCSSNNVLSYAIDNRNWPSQQFDSTTFIGLDTDVGESARTFDGSIDEVAMFDRALSPTQINAIFAAGKGTVAIIPAAITSQPTAPSPVYLTDTFQLLATVTGTTPQLQWYKNNTPIAGATNNLYAVSSANLSDSGNYYLIAANQAGSVTSSVVNISVIDYLARPINPDGTLYTGISDSSHFNGSYTAAELFDYNMTGIPVGTFITFDATEYARVGDGTCFVAFQLDQVYTNIASMFYANRYSTPDLVSQISVWSSDSTPFAAADPGISPDSVVQVTKDVTTGAVWNEYFLTNALHGRYFLLQLDQANPGMGGNPGGRELRLGALVSPVPLDFSTTPSGLILNWPTYGTLQQADNVTGPWTTATNVTNGIPVSMTATNRFYRIRY
ncbi:MAG TPA: LamG-like jellyroll fold domain-containing protein [Verrucomicrobiae bacterium]|nr:LamG-like jellyroll fold domain-containing protein [Verrucomicrobiae bacterium]